LGRESGYVGGGERKVVCEQRLERRWEEGGKESEGRRKLEGGRGELKGGREGELKGGMGGRREGRGRGRRIPAF